MGRFTANGRNTVKAEGLRFQYRLSYFCLLTATIFTALNSIFAFFSGIFYSSFSWVFPYAMITEGLFTTGMMYTPEEYEYYWGMTQDHMQHPGYLYILIGIAVVAVCVLVACCIIARKHVAGLIAATVLLAIDKLFMLLWYEISFQAFFNEFFMSGLLLGLLLMGIVAHYRLKMIDWLSDDIIPPAVPAAGQEEQQDSPVLHAIDYSLKCKILMIYDVEGYTVCYRKIGTIYELAIDKMVYDTIDAGRHRQPHELNARVNGHDIAVGTSEDATMYIRFDGNVVKKKRR